MLAMLVMAASCGSSTWSEYEYKDRNFKTQFPGKPDEKTETGRQGLIEIATTTYTVEPGIGRAFVVGVADYKSNMPGPMRWNNEEAFKGARESMITSSNGKLVSDKEVDVSGETGREFIIETTKENAFKALEAQGKRQNPFAIKNLFVPNELIISVRVVRNGNSFYQLMAIYPKGKEVPADMEKFYGSFKILEKVEDPPEETPVQDSTGGRSPGYENQGGGNENPPWGGQNP
jgi:hypothetical protein